MKKSTYLLLALLVGLMACSTAKVAVEPGLYEDFNLTDYKTYAFLEVDQSETEVPAFSQSVEYLKQEISKQLAARGLSENNSSADLKINLGIVIENKEQTRETSLATDPFMYTGQRNYTWQSEEIVVNRYKEGTLSVHLVDAQTNQAVWVGVVSEIIPTKEEKKQAAIEDAVAEVFESIDTKN
ncbi:protein of unknown function [Algoriphagus locisalis]|uniref:DUF4136 domain-containing protein n=1 Tax=Algoriphagus locisalis TaxID=305507 RepID=A0A1I6XM58_9BACT|nr:DUF4136 domain-containing protein [Algoriphagus locisalis]SFT38904.1 protein of unknown function [Algoriphagus locisalis]